MAQSPADSKDNINKDLSTSCNDFTRDFYKVSKDFILNIFC